MPLGNKKVTIFFPDDWEDSNIEKLKDVFENITQIIGYDGLVYEIEECNWPEMKNV